MGQGVEGPIRKVESQVICQEIPKRKWTQEYEKEEAECHSQAVIEKDIVPCMDQLFEGKA